MRVLILGASGLIGSNLFRFLRREMNWNVVGTHFSYPAKDTAFYNTLDPDDRKNFNVRMLNPEIIVHCGALTHVDYCEKNETESYDKTVRSTINTIELARINQSKFIYISSDYVFNGKSGPYREEDEVNPISVYGRHKLKAEKLVTSSGLDHLICRVTNVYGIEERGKNFIARLVEKARSMKEEEISLPIDQYASPVNAADVANALLQLIIAEKSGIYHLGSTDYFNRYQLAARALKYFPKNRISLRAVLTEDLGQDAARPLNGGLISAKFLSEFPQFEFTNVDDYMKYLESEDSI